MLDPLDIDYLMIEAKKTIAQKEVDRFVTLAARKNWGEARKQLANALACFVDLLGEAGGLLGKLESQRLLCKTDSSSGSVRGEKDESTQATYVKCESDRPLLPRDIRTKPG